MPASPGDTVAIVGDAHLGQAAGSVARAFHSFLADVPTFASHLVVNGDLFDFWFEYATVIPKAAFPTLSALARVRDCGVRLTLIGGNHDRFGGPFWTDQLGAVFYRRTAEMRLAGFHAFVAHGDGMAERQIASRVMHAVTRHPYTASAFRLVHPDLGFRLARWMSRVLAERTRDGPALDRAAAAQATLARDTLTARTDLDLVVLGHTHRPALVEVAPRRWYLNPGGWMDGLHYAVITPDGPELRTFDG